MPSLLLLLLVLKMRVPTAVVLVAPGRGDTKSRSVVVAMGAVAQSNELTAGRRKDWNMERNLLASCLAS